MLFFFTDNTTESPERFRAAVNCDELTMSRVVNELLQCDFERVQYCNGPRRSLFAGMLITGMGIVLLTSFVPVGFVATLFMWTVVFYLGTVYVTYGLSPLCVGLGLVPACVFEDLVQAVQYVVPRNITIPPMLVNTSRCTLEAAPYPTPEFLGANPGVSPSSVECLLPCSAPPFQFVGWQVTPTTPFLWCCGHCPCLRPCH